jgi:16S rRNA (adenine1518-N6/adenine1519-N6)-dimethyltransferase
MRARFGQNFLTDKNIAGKIIASAHIHRTDTVVEIGPGRGILTDGIVPLAGRVLAVEIDPLLCRALASRFAVDDRIKIINSDFLEWQQREKSELKFVSNLPYCVAAPIIEKILSMPNWETAVLMVQKETADRITAKPDTAEYGCLSIMVQTAAAATKLFDVPPACFRPKPKVLSTVVKLERLINPAVAASDRDDFLEMVKLAFRHRRKTLLNSLSMELETDKVTVEGMLKEARIPVAARPENADINSLVNLYKIWVKTR